MVLTWSPEPSKNKDDWLPDNTAHVITLDDESEDDNIFPLFGYELLPHDINNEYIGQETGLHSDSDSSEVDEAIQEEVNNGIGSHKSAFEEIPRQDIVINFDEVREAMSNVTLPDSAIPSWASQVPESQWTSFLLSRIRNIQNPNNSD